MEPVRREALPTVIAEQIQRFILEEGLQSGDPLPSERELLAQLGVSRSSLREALTALEMMGWLRSQQGRRRVVAVPQSFAEGLDHERLVELVRYEAIQAAQEGRQVDGLSLELDGLRQASREELERLLGRLGQAPIRADFPYVEPDDLPTILAEAGGPEGEARPSPRARSRCGRRSSSTAWPEPGTGGWPAACWAARWSCGAGRPSSGT